MSSRLRIDGTVCGEREKMSSGVHQQYLFLPLAVGVSTIRVPNATLRGLGLRYRACFRSFDFHFRCENVAPGNPINKSHNTNGGPKMKIKGTPTAMFLIVFRNAMILFNQQILQA